MSRLIGASVLSIVLRWRRDAANPHWQWPTYPFRGNVFGQLWRSLPSPGRRIIKHGRARCGGSSKSVTQLLPAGATAKSQIVDLKEVMHLAVLMTQPKWKDPDRPTSTEVELQHLPRMRGNPAEPREMMTNLIFNAVDAMPNGGTLTCRTSEAAGSVILEVVDVPEWHVARSARPLPRSLLLHQRSGPGTRNGLRNRPATAGSH